MIGKAWKRSNLHQFAAVAPVDLQRAADMRRRNRRDFRAPVPVEIGGGSKLKLLQVKFDAQGVVRAYNWSGGR